QRGYRSHQYYRKNFRDVCHIASSQLDHKLDEVDGDSPSKQLWSKDFQSEPVPDHLTVQSRILLNRKRVQTRLCVEYSPLFESHAALPRRRCMQQERLWI